MASVSGLTSIDVNSIVTQLMTVERQPLTRLQTTDAGLQTRLSAWGRLQSQLASFQDAAKTLMRSDVWGASTAASSDDTALRVSSSGGAQAGSHQVVVDAIAQRQVVASAPWSGADAIVGSGTLRISFGSQPDGQPFSADPARSAIEVELPADATLAQVRDAINAAGAGVSASLVADGSGMRLMIRGDATGAANAFSIEAGGAPALAFVPGETSPGMLATQTAGDARFSVDGLPLTSASNRLDGVLDGLVLELRRSGPEPILVDVGSDTQAMRKAVETFVSAWNSLNSLMAEFTRYDAGTRSAGALQGDSTLIALQRRLRETLTSAVDGSPLARLSSAGISLQRDGSLGIDSTRLEQALATPDQLRTLFAATSETAGGQGLAWRLDALATGALGADGSVTGATEALQSRRDRITQQQEAFEARMTVIEARLRRQYTALDASLGQMSGIASFLASRFGDDT